MPPPSVNVTLSGKEVAAYSHAAGFSGESLVTAIAIAKAESGWVINAKGGPNSNGSYDWGLFQINDVHKPSDAVKTQPDANAQFAFKLYRGRGGKFTDWATYNNKRYVDHIPAARKAVTDLQADPNLERNLTGGSGFPDLVPSAPGNPLTAIPSAISGSVNQLASTMNQAALNIGALTVGVVLLILGVIIVLRGPASKVLGNATPVGKIAKTASKVA